MFSKVITKLSSSETKSDDFTELKRSIGSDVPVWKYKEFADFLSNDIQKDLIDQMIDILEECLLVKSFEIDDQTLLVPMFLLKNEASKDLVSHLNN